MDISFWGGGIYMMALAGLGIEHISLVIHYIKPTDQLSFGKDFQNGGPIYHLQVVINWAALCSSFK